MNLGIRRPTVFRGNFPNTPILDNFNRADEGPPPSVNWLNHWYNDTGTGLIVVNNGCRGHDLVSTSYWQASTFGPDCEAYVTITDPRSLKEPVALAIRLQQPGAGTSDGYTVHNDGAGSGDTAGIYRLDNSVETLLGATFSTGGFPTSGDKNGVSCIGSTISYQMFPAGGSWSKLASRTDTTYTTAGNIGLYVSNAASSVTADDFGGGTI